ncbi:CDR ABC transporter [Penicillium expansum]|nr:CDR ABC transporter [Penicillium expansum]
MEKDYDEPEFAPITVRTATVLEEREQQTLTRIASSKLGQQLSRSASKKDGLAPHLDPTNPLFDHRRWAQMVLDQANDSGIDIPTKAWSSPIYPSAAPAPLYNTRKPSLPV